MIRYALCHRNNIGCWSSHHGRDDDDDELPAKSKTKTTIWMAQRSVPEGRAEVHSCGVQVCTRANVHLRGELEPQQQQQHIVTVCTKEAFTVSPTVTVTALASKGSIPPGLPALLGGPGMKIQYSVCTVQQYSSKST